MCGRPIFRKTTLRKAALASVLLPSVLLVPSLTRPVQAAPDTVATVRARAHQEIAKRDALIAALQQQVAAQQKQINALRGTAEPTPGLPTPPAFSLEHDVQDYNLWLKHAQEADRSRAAAVDLSMGDFDSSLKAMRDGDTALQRWEEAQQNAEDASTSRFSDEEIADMKAASKLLVQFKSNPNFARLYAEGDQCIPYKGQTPALVMSGAADLRFIVSRADLH